MRARGVVTGAMGKRGKRECVLCGMTGGWHRGGCFGMLRKRGVTLRVLESDEVTARERLAFAVLFAVAVTVFMLTLVTLLSGCHVGELAAPCDTATLERVKLECRDAVRASCKRDARGVVDETCSTLVQCTDRIERWRACVAPGADGGAP